MPDVEQAEPLTIKAWLDDDAAVLIDVREDDEVSAFRIPGARHIAMSRFDPADLPPVDGRKLVLYCAAGMRSDAVARELISRGHYDHVVNMVGGIQAWAMAQLPIES